MMMLDDCQAIGINQCLCLPKAELKTKNSTKRQLCCRLVEFLVFNSDSLDKKCPIWRNKPCTYESPARSCLKINHKISRNCHKFISRWVNRKSRPLMYEKLGPSLTRCNILVLEWLYFGTGFKRFCEGMHFFQGGSVFSFRM